MGIVFVNHHSHTYTQPNSTKYNHLLLSQAIIIFLKNIIHYFYVVISSESMNNSNSKMPLSRQLRYEKQCRHNWKDNATQKQEKIREYVQANRALKKSRDA